MSPSRELILLSRIELLIIRFYITLLTNLLLRLLNPLIYIRTVSIIRRWWYPTSIRIASLPSSCAPADLITNIGPPSTWCYRPWWVIKRYIVLRNITTIVLIYNLYLYINTPRSYLLMWRLLPLIAVDVIVVTVTVLWIVQILIICFDHELRLLLLMFESIALSHWMIWVPEAFIHASLGQTSATTVDTALEIGILRALGDDGTA